MTGVESIYLTAITLFGLAGVIEWRKRRRGLGEEVVGQIAAPNEQPPSVYQNGLKVFDAAILEAKRKHAPVRQLYRMRADFVHEQLEASRAAIRAQSQATAYTTGMYSVSCPTCNLPCLSLWPVV